jgi:thiol:disulfide interchange protein DsbD
MMTARCLALLASLSLGAALPSPAQDPGRAHVAARLASDVRAVSPGGAATLALTLTMTPGWHVYWKNPGDIGMPTVVTLDLPPGLEAGEVRWPVPARFVHEGSVSYGYEGAVTLLVDLRAAADLSAVAALPIKVRVEWLVCDPTGCFPGDAEVALELPVGAAQPTAEADAIEAARRALPVAAPDDLRAEWSDGPALTLEVPDASALTFFPHLPDDAPPEDMAARGSAPGPRLAVRYPPRVAGLPVTGVLAVTRGDRTTYHEVATTAPR